MDCSQLNNDENIESQFNNETTEVKKKLFKSKLKVSVLNNSVSKPLKLLILYKYSSINHCFFL